MIIKSFLRPSTSSLAYSVSCLWNTKQCKLTIPYLGFWNSKSSEISQRWRTDYWLTGVREGEEGGSWLWLKRENGKDLCSDSTVLLIAVVVTQNLNVVEFQRTHTHQHIYSPDSSSLTSKGYHLGHLISPEHSFLGALFISGHKLINEGRLYSQSPGFLGETPLGCWRQWPLTFPSPIKDSGWGAVGSWIVTNVPPVWDVANGETVGVRGIWEFCTMCSVLLWNCSKKWSLF